MSKINEVIHGIHHMDDVAAKDSTINNLHPLSKIIVTFMYIVVVVSFDKYDFYGVISMGIYLYGVSVISDIPLSNSFKNMKVVLILVCIVGISNPFFDRKIIFSISGIDITYGMVSMVTLMIKGIFTVCAAYFLIVTTSIEKICYGLRILHIPKGIVIVVMLIYRYIIVLLKETERMMQAYKLRAPYQKGINIKAWGSFAGQLLLRSIDRAEIVYESMLLRGFNGNFIINNHKGKVILSIAYASVWCLIFITLRVIPLFKIIGSIVV